MKGIIEDMADNEKLNSEEKTKKNVKVGNEKRMYSRKIIYIIAIIGILLAIKFVYLYGEMAIIAEGKSAEHEVEREGEHANLLEEKHQDEENTLSSIEEGQTDFAQKTVENFGELKGCIRFGEEVHAPCVECGMLTDEKGCSACVRCEGCPECKAWEGCCSCSGSEKCKECEGCEECEECEECEKCSGCVKCKDEITYKEEQLPIIKTGKPDGANGYYINIPQIVVSHKLEKVTVNYKLTNGFEEEFIGVIPIEDNFSLTNLLSEGDNYLDVWVELPDLLWKESRVFKVDRIPPQKPSISYSNSQVNDVIYSNSNVEITFQTKDSGSGVYGLLYKVGNESEKFIAGSEGTITIGEEFIGVVEVIGIDYAGNKSEASLSSLIVIDKNAPVITLFSSQDLTRWNHEGLFVNIQVEEWGVSSGLESVKVYIDNEIVLSKGWTGAEKSYLFTEGIFINKEATIGIGANLKVVARDQVGGETIVHREIRIDTKDPTISYMNAYNNMIIGSDRAIDILLEDENMLSYYEVQISHITFEGEEETNHTIKGEIGNTSQKVVVTVEKEGVYLIKVLAKDISGREITDILNVRLDKTNPTIKYVEQLDGKHIPFFQWNYQRDHMVYDESDFNYNMFLNGVKYLEGTFVDIEGSYTFRVTATDEAGNVGNAYARFVIDNTPPEIHFYNVEEGESYIEQVMLGIAVTGHGERIKRVEVNGKNSDIDRNSQMIQLRFNLEDNYVIMVEADDLAGNVAMEEITFSIGRDGNDSGRSDKESFGMAEYIGKVFGKEERSILSVIYSPLDSNANIKLITGIGLVAILVGGVFAYIIYRRKSVKSKKESD